MLDETKVRELVERVDRAAYRKREDKQGHDAVLLEEVKITLEALLAERGQP